MSSPPPLRHPVPTHPAYIPEPPSTPGSPQGYQRFSSSPQPGQHQGYHQQPPQQPHAHSQPGIPPMMPPQFGAWGVNDATAQFGMQLGSSAVAAGQDYVQRTWGGVFSNTAVKPHFNVSNSYVMRKLRIVLFPWIHKQWGRKSHRTDAGLTEYHPPREDVNSPDLYIPLMSMVTYILLCALHSGVQQRFSPQVLATRLLLPQVSGPSQSIDVIAYGGYKFVASRDPLHPRWIPQLGSTLGFMTFIYFGFANAFFLMRSLRSLVLPDAASRAASGDPYATTSGSQRRRRIAFLLVEAASQLLWMAFLVRGAH
ncbi:YIF1-domain-containing protein [Mycena haematopus]|nr:YIF1-domain-containing protein [Mycena haematopus]